MRRTDARSALLLLLVAAAGAPAAAEARPGVGPRETVDIRYTTTEPGAPVGISYSARFRDPANPNATPPALRRLVIFSPRGSGVDTSVPARCSATDAELRQEGQAACPPASRIGTGSADTKPLGFPAIRYSAVVFNAAGQQVELLTGAPPAPPTVVHAYFRGDTLDSPIPTCFNGGYAPEDCPFDQASLLGNTLVIPPYTVGSGAGRRSYLTTPPTCPASREWATVVRFHYGDGVVETLTTTQPCSPAATRLTVTPRRVRRLSKRRFRFKATVKLGGRWVPLAGAEIRFAGRKRRTDAGGRASVRVRFHRSGRRRARLSLGGYQKASTRVRVLRRRHRGRR